MSDHVTSHSHGQNDSANAAADSSTALAPRAAEPTSGPERAGGLLASEPYRSIHIALRGRYGLAVVLALLGAIGGAWLAAQYEAPLYRSEGLVRIAYTLPPVLRETDQNRPMAMFDAYLESQQLLMRSRRLLEAAVKDPVWQQTGRGDGPLVVADLASMLTVDHQPGTELIRIVITDADPHVAAAGVRAIVNTYSTIYKDEEERVQEQRLGTLEQRRQGFQQSLLDLRQRMADIADECGTADIDQLYASAAQKVQQFEEKLVDLRIEQALSDGARSTDAPALAPEQIGLVDPIMRALLLETTSLESKLRLARMRQGDEHRDVKALTMALDDATARVERYTETFRQFQEQFGGQASLLAANPARALVTPEQLRAEIAHVQTLCDAARSDMARFDAKRREVERLKAQAEQVRVDLEETEKRGEALRVESTIGGRLSIVSSGEVPVQPFYDRRIKLAAVGAVGGAVCPVGLAVLIGLCRRRFRFPDETESEVGGGERLLGVVPAVPEGVLPSEAATVAARCIHQLRAMLQVAHRQVCMVTSSSEGEGKTSLCLSLGFSFAAAGVRTIVVDADLVGRSLTSGFAATRAGGFLQALRSGSVTGCIHRTAMGLHVMTAGRGGAAADGTVSPAAVRRILAHLRERYDLILLDTGPVLGSVEAAVLAAEVDGVIVAVGRGQVPALVSRSLRHLKSVGGSIVGVVFNRARLRDFYRLGYMPSSSRRSDQSMIDEPAAGLPPTDDEVQPVLAESFGPLVRAVLTHLSGKSAMAA